MSKTKQQLTEQEWLRVFEVRCRAKQGQTLSEADMQLLNVALNDNRERYIKMDPEVFNATVPFGSTARMKP